MIGNERKISLVIYSGFSPALETLLQDLKVNVLYAIYILTWLIRITKLHCLKTVENNTTVI